MATYYPNNSDSDSDDGGPGYQTAFPSPHGGNFAPQQGGNNAPVHPGGNFAPVNPEGNFAPSNSGANNAPVNPGGNHPSVYPAGNYPPVYPGGNYPPFYPGGNYPPFYPGGNSVPYYPGSNNAPVYPGGNHYPTPPNGGNNGSSAGGAGQRGRGRGNRGSRGQDRGSPGQGRGSPGQGRGSDPTSSGRNDGPGQEPGRMHMVPVRMPTCRGDQHRIEITVPAISKCVCKVPATTELILLRPRGQMSGREYKIVSDEMHKTIRQHATQSFTKYNIIKMEKVKNCCLWKRYRNLQDYMAKNNVNEPTKVNERMLFHGSSRVDTIVSSGFDERHADKNGLFGAGIYFAEHSSKSNQYAFGAFNKGCKPHNRTDCYNCERKMLLCRVSLGKVCKKNSPDKAAHAPPGFNSVKGVPTPGGLQYPEYCVYRGEQAYPEYVITYKIVK